MQRRVEETYGNGSVLHCLVNAFKVRPAAWARSLEKAPFCAPSTVFGANHSRKAPILSGRRTCARYGKTDALRAERRSRWRRQGVSALVRTPSLRGTCRPAHDCAEVALVTGGTRWGISLAVRCLPVEPSSRRWGRPRGIFCQGEISCFLVHLDRRRSRRRSTCPFHGPPLRRERSCRRARSGCPGRVHAPSMSSGLVSRRTSTTFSPFPD